ncbi:hypothetical protein HF992_07780 [Streptococcus ovuberis]|uniref:Uncharacterized protein n=1 Tax=Streptococcus ovuberis TaxID=1936207 RepID=A0A7X6MYJ3_9STRE|nr:hypothetical protein [Streptococcus ovuberis]NKZ20730.1 hypothetical protein [Streptococcus ovuberis]
MLLPIVPLDSSRQSRQFEKKSKNNFLLKLRLGQLEISCFHPLGQDQLELILEKVLTYDRQAQ